MIATTYTGHRITSESNVPAVPFEDVRAQLRLDEVHDEDAYIKGLSYAQCSFFENQYKWALLTKTVEEFHSDFPKRSDLPLWLTILPGISVTSVKYYDCDGVEQTWSTSEWTTNKTNRSFFIIPKATFCWPTDLMKRPDAVKVTYTAGYGDTPLSIPQHVKLGLLARIGYAHVNREDPVNALTSYSDQILAPLYRFGV